MVTVMKLDLKVKVKDLRATFGNIVDVIIVECANLVKGWDLYDVSNIENIDGVIFYDISLLNEEKKKVIADVFIEFHGLNDNMKDDEVVAYVSILSGFLLNNKQ